MTIPEISEAVRTQDNRAIANPVFVVQRKRIDTGYDTQWCDDVCWVHEDGIESDPEIIKSLNKGWEESSEEPEPYTRTGFRERWEFVTACFTEKGCEDYLRQNGHKLGETRIYVESGYRNDEWKEIRQHLSKIREGEGVTP